MADDFLGQFIGNPTRARLLRVFLFNQGDPLTLAHVAKRAKVSLKAATNEAKELEQLGILKQKSIKSLVPAKKATRKQSQRIELWSVNADFKHYEALSKFVHGVSLVRYDSIVNALKHTGRLATVILSGTFLGDPSRPADIIVAADALNEGRLEAAVKALEPLFGREIRYAAFSTPEFRYRLTIQDRLIRDTLDYPHLVLLDRTRLL